jgi:hypothetical protein
MRGSNGSATLAPAKIRHFPLCRCNSERTMFD